MKLRFRIAASLLWSPVVIVSAGCSGSSSQGPAFNPGGVSVAVTASTTTVQVGSTASFIATVSGDPNDKGVTWSVSCSAARCGTVSLATTSSGVATTYTAPTKPPAGDLGVVITATSIANNLVSNSVNITVPGTSVSVTASEGFVPIGGTAQISATITEDLANQGVTWSVSCSPAPCGTVSPTMTASGVATTYTAPNTYSSGDLAVTITATSVSNPLVSNFVTVTVPGTEVSISQTISSVEAGGTAQLTATVVNDPTNQGVTWTVSCPTPPCGMISPTSTLSGAPTAYTASTTPPASDLSVTITATSVFNSVSSTATVTVLAVTVSITPASALLPLNTALGFTPTVGNDPANLGVTWTLTQGGTACTSVCGTVAPATTMSANPTTYTAPATLPANSAVVLTATSVEDPTKSGTAAITISTGTVVLVPASLNLGSVPRFHESNPQTVTLTNIGTTMLNISSLSISGTNSSDFTQTNSCGNSVPMAGSCAVAITFKPNTQGSVTATLLIADSSSDSPQQVSLMGIGITERDDAALVSSNTGTVVSPSPSGRYRVGTRIIDLVDPLREDPYVAGRKRELPVRFWYPSSISEKSCSRVEYTSPRVWNYFSQLLGVPLPDVQSNSCLNPSIAAGVHPIILFTPGYTATFTDYTFLFEDLASRGYIVASVDHTYEATAVEFPDGRFVKSVVGSHLGSKWKGDDRTLSFVVSVRLRDLRFVLNELKRLSVRADSPFVGKLDLDHVAVAGHSVGGVAAFLALEQDTRLNAAIVIDGHVNEVLIHATHRPVLIMTMGSVASSDQCRLWDNLRGPRVAVDFPGTEHVTPSDAVWLAKYAVKAGPMGPDKTVAAMRDYIAMFLDTQLLGKTRGLSLDKLSPIYPYASVTRQTESLCAEPGSGK